jgi:hypothetical protein
MKYAVSATVRATFTDCSTRITVVPPSLSARTTSRSCSTTAGAKPSESSSIITRRGRFKNAMARASICCCPPERSAAGSSSRSASTGNRSRTSSTRADLVVESPRNIQPAVRRFSPTVNDGNTPWPPGTWATPSGAISSGGAWVMSRPSKTTAPRWAGTTPEMALSNVDFPAPLVPRRAMISPSDTSRSTPNKIWTSP